MLNKWLCKVPLIPVQVRVVCKSETLTVEVSPDDGAAREIEGFTSTNRSGEIHLKRISLGIVEPGPLRDLDVGVFNTGQLVPMPLGTFSRVNPLLVTFHPIREPDAPDPLPELSLTIWCSWYAGETTLLKTLALIKSANIDVEDDEIRSLLDRYSPYL